MIKEQAEMLQEDFEKICHDNGIKSAFGFFIDKNDSAVLSFQKIDDNDLMYMINNLVLRIARKQNMSPFEVLDKLKNGIHITH